MTGHPPAAARRYQECGTPYAPGCGAPILMVEMDPDPPRWPEPKNHPVNPGSIGGTEGTIALRTGQLGLYFGRHLSKRQPPLQEDEVLAISHYATCPVKDRFRRRRRA